MEIYIQSNAAQAPEMNGNCDSQANGYAMHGAANVGRVTLNEYFSHSSLNSISVSEYIHTHKHTQLYSNLWFRFKIAEEMRGARQTAFCFISQHFDS